MVRAGQIVVDGLGNAHDPAVVAHLLHIFGDLVAGVHGIVAAVVEEIAHIVFLEDLQNTLVIGIVHGSVLQLVAAGAQRRGGRASEQGQLSGILQTDIIEPVVQNALDAVGCAQDAGDAAALQSGGKNAVSAGVDD